MQHSTEQGSLSGIFTMMPGDSGRSTSPLPSNSGSMLDNGASNSAGLLPPPDNRGLLPAPGAASPAPSAASESVGLLPAPGSGQRRLSAYSNVSSANSSPRQAGLNFATFPAEMPAMSLGGSNPPSISVLPQRRESLGSSGTCSPRLPIQGVAANKSADTSLASSPALHGLTMRSERSEQASPFPGSHQSPGAGSLQWSNDASLQARTRVVSFVDHQQQLHQQLQQHGVISAPGTGGAMPPLTLQTVPDSQQHQPQQHQPQQQQQQQQPVFLANNGIAAAAAPTAIQQVPVQLAPQPQSAPQGAVLQPVATPIQLVTGAQSPQAAQVVHSQPAPPPQHQQQQQQLVYMVVQQ